MSVELKVMMLLPLFHSVVNFYNSNTNSSPLKILGDVFIKSGSMLTVNGTGLELKGNIYCDGVYTHLASSSKLLFSGLNAQTVTGTGSITTNILEINKSSNDVTLNSTVFINGNLNLTWGIINTNQNSKIIVNDNATATNASDISYISGPIQKIGNDAFTFPVGKNGNYQSIGMDIGSGAQFSDAFTAEYFPDNPAIIFGDSLAPSLNHISHCEYWILKNDVGSAQKKVILSWDTRSCGVSNLTELTVARFNSVMWVDEGNSGTLGTVNSGTIASYTTTGYGPFTLASTTVANTLPLSLLSFTATYDGKEVKIKWMTVSELNNQYFTVERSSDGINFEKLFFTEGMGNSTNQVTYAGQDLNPLPGISYYRLKQTDFDGKTTYSFIIPVKVKREGIIILNMKSSKENSSIDIEISFPVPSNGLLEINDNNGRTIVSSKFSTPAQVRHFNFEMPGLIRGIYFLRIICDNETLLKKFIF